MRPYVVAQESATAPAVPALQQSVLEQEKSPVMNAELPELIVDMSNAAGRTRFMKRLEMLQGRHVFKIEKWRKKRSNSQNRWLFGVAYVYLRGAFKEVWGEDMSKEEVHVWCKQRFLSRPVIDHRTGKIEGHVCGMSRNLTTVEFNHFKEQIQRFAAEDLRVFIPDPNEQDVALPTA